MRQDDYAQILRTIHFVIENRKIRDPKTGARKCGWNFNFGKHRITVRELPREWLESGALGYYRFIVKKHYHKGGWCGTLGKAMIAPVALKAAFEMLLDDRPVKS